jgi:site-specific DNA-methyltransferase (adenine-specific)
MIELDQIYNEDCLEGMKRIDDASVDCIITDLPYGTTACQWDSVIPFEPLWEQYRRISKPNAAIVLFGSEPFSSALRMSAIDLYKYDWIWTKNMAAGFLEAKNKPMKIHEIISVFSKGACANGCKNRMVYNPQGLTKTSILKKNVSHNVYGNRKSRETGSTFVQEQSNYPTSVLSFDIEPLSTRFHPTQKPVDLLRYLIRTYTDTDNLVLDSCMGSGTTAIAAIKEHRHFLGFELNKEYFDIAQRRIRLERQQPQLDFADG